MNYDSVKDAYPYIGSWKVVKCVPKDENCELSKIEGTIIEFEPERIIDIANKKLFKNKNKISDSSSSNSDEDDENIDLNNNYIDNFDDNIDDDDDNNKKNEQSLDDENLLNNFSFKNGDVIWHLVDGNDHLPFFECKTFQYDDDLSQLKLYGSITGMTIHFSVNFDDSLNFLYLEYENVLRMECQRLFIDEDFDSRYGFITVFNDDFLSDICIKSSSGRSYYAHKSIVYLTLKNETDDLIHKFKYNNDDDLIELILYYCYSNCLPSTNINQNKSNFYFNFIRQFKNLNNLEVLLNTLFVNISFKQQISNIIKEIKESTDRVVVSFRCREEQVAFGGIFAEPAKLCEILKSAIKEIAFAFVKCVTIFDLFSLKQDKLSKAERHDIIKEVKQSLPFFIKQIHKLLYYVYIQIRNLTEIQRRELAEYFVLKIDSIVTEVLKLVASGQVIFDKLLNVKDQKDKSKSIKIKLEKSLKSALHVKELKQLKKYNDEFVKQFTKLKEKLEEFRDLNPDAKLNVIFKELNSCLDNLKQHAPSFLRKIEQYSLNDYSTKSVSFKNFKYTFKCLASKTMWILDKFRSNKGVADAAIKELCAIIDEKNFINAVDALNLTTMPLNSESSANCNNNEKINNNESYSPSPAYVMDSLYQPQSANKNPLAESANELYKTRKFADIEFEIINVNNEGKSEKYSIKVHGVIVASRCMWFKRALSSGMKEAIDKKVVLHDTNMELFEIFVRYLYSGSISSIDLNVDELIELATLADKYECDSLKYLIQRKAMKKFNENVLNDELMIFELLNIADRFNLDLLKKFCIDYIENHTRLHDSEEFSELPEHLTKLINLDKHKNSTSGYKTITPKIQSRELYDCEFGSDSENEDYNHEYENILAQQNAKRDLLLSYAHPLIVADYHSLEECYDKLKQLLAENEMDFEDSALVRSIITNDYDINRVLLNDIMKID